MTRPDPIRTALAVVAGAFGSLDTALNIAFPDLLEDFGLAVGDLQWVVVCYVLSYGALLLAAGQLGDVIGHRRVLGFGAALSTVALLICALANTFGALLVGRVVQGIGVSMVMASAPALLTTAVPARDSGDPPGRGRAVGAFQTSAAIGLAIGPIVGGPLVDLAGWRGVFWFRVPIAVVLVAFSIRADPTEAPRTPTGARGDRRGAALAAATLGAAVFSFNRGGVLGFTHPAVLASAVTAIGFGWAFVVSSRRADAPLLDLDLFRSGSFARANALAVLSNGAMFATWLLVPSLLIDGIGTSLFVGGLVLAASPMLTAALSPFAGRIADRRGARTIAAAGLGLEAVGMFALSRADSDWSPWAVAGAIAIVGAGLGLFTVPNMSVVMGRLPDDKQGVAGGLSLMTRTIGIVAGVAVASAVFDAIEPERGVTAAFSTVFVASAVTLAAAALLAAWPASD